MISSQNRLRVNDSQLVALAIKARTTPTCCGWVKKKSGGDGVGSPRWQRRWLVLHQNMLFYFESDTAQRPQGVIFVEQCDCRLMECLVDSPPERYAFTVGIQGVSQRQFIFATVLEEDCKHWVKAIQESCTEQQLRELARVKEQCERLASQLETRTAEVSRLSGQLCEQEDELSRVRSQLRADTFSLGHAKRDVVRRKTLEHNYNLVSIIKLQKKWRKINTRRRFFRLVRDYLASRHAEKGRQRIRLIWKLVAIEEEYVAQLNMLSELFLKPMRMAAESSHPKVKLSKVLAIFRNIEQISTVHEVFLAGLHKQVERWPVMRLGWLLEVTFPSFSLYQDFVRNHQFAKNTIREVFATDAQPLGGKDNIEQLLLNYSPLSTVETLQELLTQPTLQLSYYSQLIKSLLDLTPSYHIDHSFLEHAASTLSELQATIDNEASYREKVTKTLKVESTISRGCVELLNPKQSLVRNGILTQQKVFTSRATLSKKEKKAKARHCFLFSQHLIITRRVSNETVELVKDIGVLPLKGCVFEEKVSPAELEGDGLLAALAFRLHCTTQFGHVSCIFSCGSPRDKTSWSADITQCLNNIEMEGSAVTSEKTEEYASYMDAVLLSPEITDGGSGRFLSSSGSPRRPASIRTFQLYRTTSMAELKKLQYESSESLCQRLVHPKGFFKEYLDIFLATMSAFMTPMEVLEFLIKCFNEIHSFRSQSSASSPVKSEQPRESDENLVTPAMSSMCSPRASIENERSVLRRERQTEEWGKSVLLSPSRRSIDKKEPVTPQKQPNLRNRRAALTDTGSSPSIKSFSPFRTAMKRTSGDRFSGHSMNPGGRSFVSHLPSDVIDSPEGSPPKSMTRDVGRSTNFTLEDGHSQSLVIKSPLIDEDDCFREKRAASASAVSSEPTFAVAHSLNRKSCKSRKKHRDASCAEKDEGSDALRPEKDKGSDTSRPEKDSGRKSLSLTIPDLKGWSPLGRRKSGTGKSADDRTSTVAKLPKQERTASEPVPSVETIKTSKPERTASVPMASADTLRDVRCASEGSASAMRNRRSPQNAPTSLTSSPSYEFSSAEDVFPPSAESQSALSPGAMLGVPSADRHGSTVLEIAIDELKETDAETYAAARAASLLRSLSPQIPTETPHVATGNTPPVLQKSQSGRTDMSPPASPTPTPQPMKMSLIRSSMPLQPLRLSEDDNFDPKNLEITDCAPSPSKATPAYPGMIEREVKDEGKETDFVDIENSDSQRYAAYLATLLPPERIDEWVVNQPHLQTRSSSDDDVVADSGSQQFCSDTDPFKEVTEESEGGDGEEESQQSVSDLSPSCSGSMAEGGVGDILEDGEEDSQLGDLVHFNDGEESPSILGDAESIMRSPPSVGSEACVDFMSRTSTKALAPTSLIFDGQSMQGNTSIGESIASVGGVGEQTSPERTSSATSEGPKRLQSPWQIRSSSRKRLAFHGSSEHSTASVTSEDLLSQPHLHRHILLRIFCILRKWVQNHFQDFACDSDLLQILVKFINNLSGQSRTTQDEARSLQVIQEVVDRQRQQQAEFNFATLKTRFKETSDKLPGFLSLEVDAVAKQIAFLGFSLINAIPGKELVSCAFTKPDRKSAAPNVIAVSDFYNQITGLIMWEILQRKNGTSRAAVMEKWISIGNVCLTMNNFYGVMMVTGALNTPAINRLAKSWQHISKPKTELWEALAQASSPNRNFAEMRQRLNECTLPALPYLGCCQKDLIYLNETKTRNAEGKVNFSKMKRMYHTLKLLQQYQREPYDVTPDEKVLRYLLNTSHIPNEEVLFEQSLRVEPRQH